MKTILASVRNDFSSVKIVYSALNKTSVSIVKSSAIVKMFPAALKMPQASNLMLNIFR